MKTILVLAPHTDDGELGCGASIAKFLEAGDKVIYAAFSTCRRSLPEGWEPDTLEKEVKNATLLLGIKAEDLIIFDYDVRKFKEDRQSILEDIVVLGKRYKPDFVFVPSPMDIHQDHQVISEEGLRAFKNTTILGYEMPWNNLTFNTRAFIKLDDAHLQKKVQALGAYKSQSNRKYLTEDFIYSLAKIRGVQCGSDYAEAFEVIRMIFD